MFKHMLGGLVALSMLPSIGLAAITNTDLEEFETHLWLLRADFHMITIMSGSSTYSDDLERSLSAAQETFSRLNANAEGAEERAFMESLAEDWELFSDSVASNTYAEQGYTNSYTKNDVNQLPALMEIKISEFTGAENAKYHDVRALSAFLMRMSSEYLNVAADPAGGMASGTGEGRIEFEDTVPEFERMLAEVRARYKDDESINRALDDVATKWGFIRESMVKFYENAVPFLVYRYTKQMADTIDQAVSFAGSDIQKPVIGGVE